MEARPHQTLVHQNGAPPHQALSPPLKIKQFYVRFARISLYTCQTYPRYKIFCQSLTKFRIKRDWSRKCWAWKYFGLWHKIWLLLLSVGLFYKNIKNYKTLQNFTKLFKTLQNAKMNFFTSSPPWRNRHFS